MELTDWTRTDALVSCLNSLGDHCKNGRGKESNEVVLKIQRNGAQFQEGIEGVNDGLKEVFENKKESLEAMQEKMRGLEDLVQSLNKEIKEIEETIDCAEQNVRLYEERDKRAEERFSQGRKDLDEGQKQICDEVKQVNHVQVRDLVAKIDIVQSAVAKVSEAMYEKEQAQSSLKDAFKHEERAVKKRSKVRKLMKNVGQKIDGLHQEVTIIKATIASSFEIRGVLKELLVYTNTARGKTDRLTTILSQYATKPGALRSRGTGAMLEAHERLWGDVRITMQTILTGENAYIFQEAALRMRKRTLLKAILSLFTTLWEMIAEARDVDEMKKCLKKLEAKGANFLDCIRRELESIRNRREQLQIEMLAVEDDRSLRDQLDDIGVNVGDIIIDNELKKDMSALQIKKELEFKLQNIKQVAMWANDRHHPINEFFVNEANAQKFTESPVFKHEVEQIEIRWHRIDGLVKALPE